MSRLILILSFYFIYSLVLLSCKETKVNRIQFQRYDDCRCNKMVRFFQYTNHPNLYYIFDSAHNYKFNSCVLTEKGKWVQRNDSILLYCEESKFVIDSLNRSGYNGWYPSCPPYPYILRISKKEIIENFRGERICYRIR